MRNTNERNRKNMKCTQCRRLIFGILDWERQNGHLSDEDEEICPICHNRLGREFELGRMRCTCTARFITDASINIGIKDHHTTQIGTMG
jgi:hypothetical protein